MHFHTISPKSRLGAGLRSLQEGQRRRTIIAGPALRAGRTTKGVVLNARRRGSTEESAGSSIPRYG